MTVELLSDNLLSMPLLSPNQIHAALKPALREKSEKTNLLSLLEDANLTPQEVLENLASLMRSGETDGVRLRAAEVGLKLNGMLTDTNTKPDFTVTINIMDGEFRDLNPILIPREIPS